MKYAEMFKYVLHQYVVPTFNNIRIAPLTSMVDNG